MHLKDLREYIQALEKIGEVQSIEKSVDLLLEAGGIIRRSYDLRAPAPLFENLHYNNKEIYKGMRVLGAPAATSSQPKLFLSRAAISLGLEPTASASEVIEALGKLIHAEPMKPVMVDTGPCKENILLGDDIDLHKMPAPQINTNDGGRYLQTFGVLVAKTVEGDWVNWGIARGMIRDDKVLLVNVTPPQDTTFIRNQWFEQGKPMPIAIVQGGPPIIPFAGSMTLGHYVSECEKIGGYWGEPVELVKCETVDLEVPATAEIVIEGEFSPTETDIEGPMGEFSGSVCLSSKGEVPILTVKAITYRNDAILPVVASGYPIEENHAVWCLSVAARIHSDLKAAGFPVAACFVPFQSAVHSLVITIPIDYIKHHRNLGDYSPNDLIDQLTDVLFAGSPGNWFAKIFVMADDIDPSDLDDVFWAYSTRSHPDNERKFPDQDVPMSHLMTYLSKEEVEAAKSTKVVYNCLIPAEKEMIDVPIPSKFESNWPKATQKQVVENWEAYGYKKVVE